ncbi:MAG: asparagine synthase (glutamine-hydrolyzing) [Planctomycetaceae bacterium]
MCGIAGCFRYSDSRTSGLSESIGLQMVDALAHRGPDDGGLLVTDRLLLGHRRLSIIDPSPDGHQPMTDEREDCWIVFNGEIYNFRGLRDELKALGETFRSRTDTEVILRGYRRWGQEVVNRLNGMFAFALYDRRNDSVWLVRDSLGIKPLFYRRDESMLWFGSEIKAILADSTVPRQADLQGIDYFLTYGYTPAPWTGFGGISQLEPGTSLLARNGQIAVTRWSQLPYPATPPTGSLADCTERLETALDSAVQRQMVSDVPLGALLSGGLDSTAIVRSMRRSGASDVETFTVAFGERSFDESPFASQAAERYGTRHHCQAVADDAASLLPTLVSHAEEPFSDNSMIPFFRLAEQTRKHVTVALSGDGADELMAGYMTYRASHWAPWYRKLPNWLRRGVLEPVVHRLPNSKSKYGTPDLLRRFLSAAGRPFPFDHCSWRRIVSESLRRDLYAQSALSQLTDDPLRPYADSLEGAPDWASALERQLHLDLRFHLPNDMLVKVDRMSMAHALEVRVPFLDQEVVAACLAMPADSRYQKGQGKRPLKQLLAQDFPADFVDRKKAGFLAPIEQWLRGPWQPLLRSNLTSEFAAETQLLNGRILKRMLDDHAAGRVDWTYPLFSLLILSLWWQTWLGSSRRPACVPVTFVPTQVHRLTPDAANL